MTALAPPSAFPSSVRVPALGADGMVTSSHPAISRTGAEVLATGGNAVDAALAMAAVAWLALPGQCGVGGDMFALVHEPGGQVEAFCGSGFGPDGGTPDRYAGAALLPRYGPLSVAAPGAVAALTALHAAGATRPLTELWEPAVRMATGGLPCTARTRDDIDRHRERLAANPETAAALLRDGRAPAVGTRLAQPELARSIAALARDPDALYTGTLAERAVEALAAGGAPFSGAEWAASGHVVGEAPLRGRYAGRNVYQTPLPTPGWMVVDQLAVCDGELRAGGTAPLPLGAEAVHWLAGAARIAFDDRYDRAGSDRPAPDRAGSPEALAEARERIRARDLPMPAGARPDGDTTSMVAVDGDGRAVGLIVSLAFTFGSGTTVPGTGIVLNNRLARGAYLVPGHPNEVRPRRRPLHTLNTWLVTDDDGRLLHVGNTPGGDGQVQWNVQLISHLLDQDADPQDAVDAPRFSVFPGSDAGDLGSAAELRCEDRLGPEVLAGLAERGHHVVRVGDGGGGGSAQIVSVDHRTGCLAGGSDFRQEGVALGV
ncbi:gamma-glutamyltransferase family protein [Pseudonocardia parietis]|uniref:Gamma-glutamyltranspeptidase/glutathione hydrolase n=1 Tax=Pseudonocardia parietis TaxID=570936 RepID=A0ABS4VSR8_9PSEU|nr:gamma-glutamyltransferase [Pseudonocardia parietis]MBP2366967.1 gamma-glutamyltranspeptidase/glutathione hydrolase [Pseudonocardia parietis]